MPMGALDQTTTMATFRAAQAKLTAGQWTSGDANKNLELLAGPALQALASAGIPKPGLVTADIAGGLGAMFMPDYWVIRGAKALYEQKASGITDAFVRAKAADMYHEARHAEQFFLAARMIAGKQKPTGGGTPVALTDSEQNLVDKTPTQTAAGRVLWRAAESARLTPSEADAKVLAGWLADYAGIQAVVDDLSKARKEVADLGDKLSDHAVALKIDSPDDCPEAGELVRKQTQLAELTRDWYQRAYRAYLNQSTEVDAYGVGSQVGGDSADTVKAQMESYYQSKVATYLDALTGKYTRAKCP